MSRGNITADQIADSEKHGNGALLQMSDGSGASGNLAKFDANGNVTDSGAALGPIVGFIIGDGTAGTNVGPMLAATRNGTVSKCVIVVKASDASTVLTFKIKQNGTDVFSSDPTVAAATASGTVSTVTALTSTPLTVAANDVFSIDITSGTSSWKFTAQLE